MLEATGGEDALALFTREQPDAVLMDRWMPVMDGFEATKKLKTLEGGSNTPVIILTADLMEQEERASNIAGADGFLHKPLEEEELFYTLCRHLNIDPA